MHLIYCIKKMAWNRKYLKILSIANEIGFTLVYIFLILFVSSQNSDRPALTQGYSLVAVVLFIIVVHLVHMIGNLVLEYPFLRFNLLSYTKFKRNLVKSEQTYFNFTYHIQPGQKALPRPQKPQKPKAKAT